MMRHGLAFLLLASSGAAQEAGLPPAGFGTLRQDEIAVRIRSRSFEIRVFPVEERIIRLLAPDAYQSLSALVASRRAEIQRVANRSRIQSPTVMLVTVFAVQPDVRFDPQQLLVTTHGQIFRPVEIIPITPGWNQQQIPQRTQLMALYVYESGIPTIEDAFEVEFEGIVSRQWQRSRQLLESEWAQVLTRAARDSTFLFRLE